MVHNWSYERDRETNFNSKVVHIVPVIHKKIIFNFIFKYSNCLIKNTGCFSEFTHVDTPDNKISYFNKANADDI